MKRLLFGIGFVLLILLILGFIAEKEYVVERSIEIDAPKNYVYERYLNSLQHIYTWSSPVNNNSASTIDYIGLPGTVNAQAYWSGHGTEGKEEVKAVLPVHRFETEVRYKSPWESVNQRRLFVKGATTDCTVTHRFEGHDPFPFNIRHLFVDMDQQLGVELTRSLSKLKSMAEKTYIDKKHNITIDSMGHRTLLLIHQIKEGPQPEGVELVDLIPRLDSIIKTNQLDSLGPIRRLVRLPMSTGNEVNGFALEVTNRIDVKMTEQILELEPHIVLKALHYGSLLSLSDTKDELREYIQEQGINEGIGLEEVYLVGAAETIDTSDWLTEIRIQIDR